MKAVSASIATDRTLQQKAKQISKLTGKIRTLAMNRFAEVVRCNFFFISTFLFYLYLVGTDVNLSWHCCLSYLMWLGTSIPIEVQADH